jgi:hypothetical protein
MKTRGRALALSTAALTVTITLITLITLAATAAVATTTVAKIPPHSLSATS